MQQEGFVSLEKAASDREIRALLDNGSGNNTILCSKFPFPNVFLSSSDESRAELEGREREPE